MMKLIDTQIEVNEDFIPNSNITYDIYWDGKLNFEARLSDTPQNFSCVSIEDAPKTIKYVMVKPLAEFTSEEKSSILNYRGLSLENDGFEASDVFMEKSHIKLVKTLVSKEEFIDWILEDAEDFYANQDWMLDHLKRFGRVTTQDLFSHCGYIPNRMLVEPTEDDEAEFTPNVDCELED